MNATIPVGSAVNYTLEKALKDGALHNANVNALGIVSRKYAPGKSVYIRNYKALEALAVKTSVASAYAVLLVAAVEGVRYVELNGQRVTPVLSAGILFDSNGERSSTSKITALFGTQNRSKVNLDLGAIARC